MRFSVLLAASAVVLAGCAGGEQAPETETPTATPSPQTVSFEAIRFETEMGPVTVILYPDAAPRTVGLLKAYIEERYYAGREFNRVVPGHVIQIVDKAGGATDDPRTVPLETHPDFQFSAGAAGIARGSDPNSGGPEFFIMDFATSHLDGNYTVWGQVVEGLEIVHRAARVQAVEPPRPPQDPIGLGLMDRMAVDAVAITDARMTQFEMPGDEAAAFPMRVAMNVRAADYRHSLEWPRSLSPGSEQSLTWYVRPYNESVPPAPQSVRIEIGSANLSVVEDVDATGAFAFRWAPPSPGEFNATLRVGSEAWATLRIVVP